jgi:hypothetical protein
MEHSITRSQDFKDSLFCLDCVYDPDLGYNGEKLCLPRKRSCKPIYIYDWLVSSRLRYVDMLNVRSTPDIEGEFNSKDFPVVKIMADYKR